MATDTCFSGFVENGHKLASVGVASSEVVSSCAMIFSGCEAGLQL